MKHIWYISLFSACIAICLANKPDTSKHTFRTHEPVPKTFVRDVPPVPLDEVKRIEFLEGQWDEWEGTTYHVVFTVEDPETVAALYESLRLGTTDTNVISFSGHLARHRWFGEGTNLLFSSRVYNAQAAVSIDLTEDENDMYFSGQNFNFAEVNLRIVRMFQPSKIARLEAMFSKLGKSYEEELLKGRPQAEQPAEELSPAATQQPKP